MIRPPNVGLFKLLLADVGHPTNQFTELRCRIILNQLICLLHIWINRSGTRLLSSVVHSRYPASRHSATAFGFSMPSPIASPGLPRRRHHAAPHAHSASCRHVSAGRNHGRSRNPAYRLEFPSFSEGSAYRPETLSLELKLQIEKSIESVLQEAEDNLSEKHICLILSF